MVQIFLDTASLNEIEEISSWGLIDGVTTNQKIFLAEGGVDFRRRVLDICSIVDGPISVETTKNNVRDLLDEAREYASWHKNIVIKVAMFGNGDGLKVVNQLTKEGIRTNMTVMMTFNQLVLATKAGANFVSLFYNRAKEVGEDPNQIIRDYVSFCEGRRLHLQADCGKHQNSQRRLYCDRVRSPRHDHPHKNPEGYAFQQENRGNHHRIRSRLA